MIRGGNAASGYTMIETIIFLAVTSLLFVSAIGTVSGKQASVQFAQGSRDAQSKVQDVINQVASGYFPSKGSFTCDVAPGVDSPPTFTAVARPQGTSNKCVFLGKVLQLGTNVAESDKYNVISMAARRTTVTSLGREVEVSNLKEAIPTAIADITESFTFQFGLAVTRVVVPDTPGVTYGSVVFFSTLPKFQGNTGTLASGAQRVSFGAVPTSALNDSLATAITKANSLTDVSNPVSGKNGIVINPPRGIVICFADGPVAATAKRKAMITVGEGASQTVAKLDEGGYSTALCES